MVQTYAAAVLLEPQKIVLEEKRLSTPLASREVLIRVSAAGVCGTDLAIYDGSYRVPLPLVLGHEFSGVVVETGSARDVRKLVGARVVSEINATCVARGEKKCCEACRRGFSNHCHSRTVVGIVQHDGAFAEYVRVPAGCVHVLPPTIDDFQAIFVEPLAAALRTFELSPIEPGHVVVVLGCGRLGKLVALAASKLGARVIVVARHPHHFHYVSSFVDTGVVLSSEPPSDIKQRPLKRIVFARHAGELQMLVLDKTRGMGADVVVEATGDPDMLTLATKLVRPQGSIALKSTPGVPARHLDTTFLAVDEIRLQGSRCGPFDKAIQFIETWNMPTADWITERYDLTQVAEALEAARTVPKVAICVSRTTVSAG